MSIKTLVINPGSTSTKVGVFEDETRLQSSAAALWPLPPRP